MSLLRRAAEPPGGQPSEVLVSVAVEDDLEVADEDDGPFEPGRWAGLARAVLATEGVLGPAELTLTFVDEASISELNKRWMGEEGPTDVLSFPLDGAEPQLPGVPRLLGDVVLCPAVARRYAHSHARRAEDELALLVVHGVLHVLGHDHAEAQEEAAMHAREDHHLRLHHDPAWTRSAS
ncbi:MAG: rRNA maturation RNase YbeY [Acidimicrobiia bacterium]|nr:rRNA maturation RNase YbeY [Acidimicrobiia bacterium]